MPNTKPREKNTISAKERSLCIKKVLIWDLVTATAFFVLITLGFEEGSDLRLGTIMAILLEHPYMIIHFTLTSLLVAPVPSLIHFGLFAIVASKRNWQTFARISKGWGVALICFVALGLIAANFNDSVRQKAATYPDGFTSPS